MSKPRHPSRTMRAAHVLKCKPLCVAISHANRARVGVWQKQSFGNNASATVDAALTHAAVTGFPAISITAPQPSAK